MPLPDNGRISTTQLIFILMDYIIPSTLILSMGIEIKQDAWLALLIGNVLSLVFALVYLVLANRFSGLTLIAINDRVWGPFLGKIISAGFLLFYLFVTFLAVFLTAAFQKEFLVNTPLLPLILLTGSISFIMVNCGLEVIARCSQIIIIFLFVMMVFILLLMIPEIKLTNFQPLFQTPFPVSFQVGLRVAAHSFGSGLGYLMVFPLARDYRQMYPAVIKAYAFALVCYFMGFILTWGSLGPTANFFTYPALAASRLISIGAVFSRMEVFVGIIIWMWGFLGQTMFIYILTTASGEFFKLKSYRSLCLPLWLLLALLGVHTFVNNSDLFDFSLRVYQWIIFPFQYILPVLTLLVAVIRKLPREDKSK